MQVIDYPCNDETLEVHFYASKEERETRDNPRVPAEIEIDKIMFKGVDVYPIIGYDVIEEIENFLTEEK